MKEINQWIDGYKVSGFDWIDGKHYYLNILYYKPGASLSKPPAIDRSVLIPKTEKQMNILENYLHTVINAVMSMKELEHETKLPVVSFDK